MVTLTALWLPILLAAVFVFVVSSVVHMVLPHHKSDYVKIDREDEVLAELLDKGVLPGEYMFPMPASMADMKSPEMQEKYRTGPVGWLTVMPAGGWNMGKSLGQWFLFSVLVSLLVAYVGSVSLEAGAEFISVFRLTATVAFLGYAVGDIPNSVWKGVRWSVTAKFIFDGVIYGLDRALYNDVADPATLEHTLDDVPAGTYTAITFTWGLDADKNVAGALPDNPQNNNMFWPGMLGGGYHYSKCEGLYLDPLGAQKGYATHTGRVRRDIDTEDHHHFFTVTLPIALTVDGDTWNVPLVMDLNQWYEDPNVYDFPDVPMIMNDLDRQRMLMENGASAFTIGGITSR